MNTIQTTPYAGQEPVTSVLRKKATFYKQENISENFVQSIFDSLDGFKGQILVVLGDERFYDKSGNLKDYQNSSC